MHSTWMDPTALIGSYCTVVHCKHWTLVCVLYVAVAVCMDNRNAVYCTHWVVIQPFLTMFDHVDDISFRVLYCTVLLVAEFYFLQRARRTVATVISNFGRS